MADTFQSIPDPFQTEPFPYFLVLNILRYWHTISPHLDNHLCPHFSATNYSVSSSGKFASWALKWMILIIVSEQICTQNSYWSLENQNELCRICYLIFNRPYFCAFNMSSTHVEKLCRRSFPHHCSPCQKSRLGWFLSTRLVQRPWKVNFCNYSIQQYTAIILSRIPRFSRELNIGRRNKNRCSK